METCFCNYILKIHILQNAIHLCLLSYYTNVTILFRHKICFASFILTDNQEYSCKRNVFQIQYK